ncbi:hypothetical protein, partial [Acinetobacter sp.]|uniref:hypothetical protein n=1 Tax=Acinetobacter sp. TaxID=472 RepID=UPI0025BB63BD
DIIDSGIINHFNRSSNHCAELSFKLKKCLDSGVVVEDGIAIENEEIYNSIFRNHYLRAVDFAIHPPYVETDKTSDDDDEDDDDYDSIWYPLASDDEGNAQYSGSERAHYYKTHYNNITNRALYAKPYFIKYEMFNHLFNANPGYFKEINDFERWKSTF